VKPIEGYKTLPRKPKVPGTDKKRKSKLCRDYKNIAGEKAALWEIRETENVQS